MLRIQGKYSRRELLKVGSLSSLGLSLGQLMANQASANNAWTPEFANALQARGIAGSFGKAKRCIVLFMLGGPPQHETWDPKPDAPAEVRGDFKPIATATPGLHVGELMPQTAKLTNHIAVLRAMATDDNAHSASGYWMLTVTPTPLRTRKTLCPAHPTIGLVWPLSFGISKETQAHSPARSACLRKFGIPADCFGQAKMPVGLVVTPTPGSSVAIQMHLIFGSLISLFLQSSPPSASNNAKTFSLN